MHEYSIVQSLVNRVEAEAAVHGATSVHRLEVRIGEQAGVEIDLLRTAWETFRDRTICAGATLDVVPVPLRWACAACDREIERGAILSCPDCGTPAKLTEGDEIVLQRVEMEVA